MYASSTSVDRHHLRSMRAHHYRQQLKRSIVIITGPTAAGKSDFSCQFACEINAEIVNADMGQLYTPLSIGTAKPNWRVEKTPHHLFDVIDTPADCTVIEYRNKVIPIIEGIWSRGAIPLVVGGSGFYVQSLLFPPAAGSSVVDVVQEADWEMLNSIDPERARHIHPHDSYRILRALSIWKATGIKPSSLKRSYEPLGNTVVVWVTRDKQQLDERINDRVFQMIDQGWLEECQNLINTPWEHFVRKKKLIGYCELFDYLQGSQNPRSLQNVIAIIQQKTRNYAKRQKTFWKMFKKQLDSLAGQESSVIISELNLTLEDPRLYINQLLQDLKCSPEQRMS